MLISQDRLEACCWRNEGEHACTVETLLPPLHARCLPSPQSLFLLYCA